MIKPYLLQTNQPSENGNLSYREIYQVINSNAFAVLLAAVIVTWVVSRQASKVVKLIATTPWFAHVPQAVNTVCADLPGITDKINSISVQANEILQSIDALEKRTIIQEVQLEQLRGQLTDLINSIRDIK